MHPSSQPHSLALRAVAWCLLVAHASLGIQWPALFGPEGLTPIALNDAAPSAVNRLGPHVLLLVGCLVSALAAAGVVKPVRRLPFGLLVLTAALTYNALFSSATGDRKLNPTGSPFLSFQWDILLLEVGFAVVVGLLFAPLQGDTSSPLSPIGLWLLRFTAFKLMLMSGAVKIQADDKEWLELTATETHFASQCLPGPLSWWFATLFPPFAHKLNVALTLWLEGLPGTILLLVGPLLAELPQSVLLQPFKGIAAVRVALGGVESFGRTLAAVAFGGQALLQLLIITSGSYTFFNVLTIALCAFSLPSPSRSSCSSSVTAAQRASRRNFVSTVLTSKVLHAALVVGYALWSWRLMFTFSSFYSSSSPSSDAHWDLRLNAATHGSAKAFNEEVLDPILPLAILFSWAGFGLVAAAFCVQQIWAFLTCYLLPSRRSSLLCCYPFRLLKGLAALLLILPLQLSAATTVLGASSIMLLTLRPSLIHQEQQQQRRGSSHAAAITSGMRKLGLGPLPPFPAASPHLDTLWSRGVLFSLDCYQLVSTDPVLSSLRITSGYGLFRRMTGVGNAANVGNHPHEESYDREGRLTAGASEEKEEQAARAQRSLFYSPSSKKGRRERHLLDLQKRAPDGTIEVKAWPPRDGQGRPVTVTRRPELVVEGLWLASDLLRSPDHVELSPAAQHVRRRVLKWQRDHSHSHSQKQEGVESAEVEAAAALLPLGPTEAWVEIPLPYKPASTFPYHYQQPAQAAPHQPRLDWQFWFAALVGESENEEGLDESAVLAAVLQQRSAAFNGSAPLPRQPLPIQPHQRSEETAHRYAHNPWLVRFLDGLLHSDPAAFALIDSARFPLKAKLPRPLTNEVAFVPPIAVRVRQLYLDFTRLNLPLSSASSLLPSFASAVLHQVDRTRQVAAGTELEAASYRPLEPSRPFSYGYWQRGPAPHGKELFFPVITRNSEGASSVGSFLEHNGWPQGGGRPAFARQGRIDGKASLSTAMSSNIPLLSSPSGQLSEVERGRGGRNTMQDEAVDSPLGRWLVKNCLEDAWKRSTHLVALFYPSAFKEPLMSLGALISGALSGSPSFPSLHAVLPPSAVGHALRVVLEAVGKLGLAPAHIAGKRTFAIERRVLKGPIHAGGSAANNGTSIDILLVDRDREASLFDIHLAVDGEGNASAATESVLAPLLVLPSSVLATPLSAAPLLWSLVMLLLLLLAREWFVSAVACGAADKDDDAAGNEENDDDCANL